MTFILASRSPRRRMLLEQAGLSPDIVPADVDEAPQEGEAPAEYALRVAWAKAEAVAVDERVVLASDTVVALDGVSLGKASDREHASRILHRLSGRSHWVHTAVVVLGRRSFEEIVSAEVSFRRLSALEIGRYLDTDEPYDKAGAYGIQGHGGAFVDRLSGSYSAVVGLPMKETLRMLEAAGVERATA
ncbi:MAG: Maf family protein [Myxococcota bacterium]